MVMNSDGICLWSQQESYFDFEMWDSECDKTFYFYDGKGPHYNGFKYCPYCGKELIEKGIKQDAKEFVSVYKVDK